MSGGSYEYLLFADAGDLITSKRSELERMLDDVAALGYANDFAAELASLLGLIRRYEIRADEILRTAHDVLRAMEWWKSCDWGEDQFKAALDEWRAEK